MFVLVKILDRQPFSLGKTTPLPLYLALGKKNLSYSSPDPLSPLLHCISSL